MKNTTDQLTIPLLLHNSDSTGGIDISVPGDVGEYVEGLIHSNAFAGQITCHKVSPETPAHYGTPIRPWPRAVQGVLDKAGIESLYSHQALATDAIRSGKSVVVATATASGKSLVYNLPVLERLLADPDAKSLFLFPLKALAQDQLVSFNELTAHWPKDAQPHAAVYDGDTSPYFRKKIRENPPGILFTNPEMLHLSILPHHHLWSTMLAGLSYIVVDEVHTYRGLLGAHMAQLFRRLLRIAALYGASPTFIFCSATVGNPAELAHKLTGVAPVPILESGAPQGKRHFIFINPEDSPASTSIKLLKSALARNLRTIVYCQSRRMTELISLWAAQGAGKYAEHISAYRAGFLPEERREIEARMASGELLAIITTSALELGIDIGSLDLCILVGYPGTVMATVQRGGRVGRSMRESAVVLVAQEDALDQYIIRHPEDFFSRPPETAVINPENPVILARHLECAAAELPLRLDRKQDAVWMREGGLEAVRMLEKESRILRSADGQELICAHKNPQRNLSLRGSGATVIIKDENETIVGSVDGIRAMREAHPGAIYLHRGQYYEIKELDIPAGQAIARKKKPSWYTRPRSTKDTDILSVEKSRVIGGMALQFGKLRVTDRVTGYERRNMQSGQLLGVMPLDFPPQIFETEGFWFLVPSRSQAMIEEGFMHFMGSIHALEHAAIGILPLLVMTDRNDLGGISKPMHLQTGRPTIFVYDGMPGGAGLSREAFNKAEEMFSRVRNVIAECPCDLGCPSCVHSPKCGSGNRPIDKIGALRLLESMLRADPASIAEAHSAINAPFISPPERSLESTKEHKIQALSWDSVLSGEADAIVPLDMGSSLPLNTGSFLPDEDFFQNNAFVAEKAHNETVSHMDFAAQKAREQDGTIDPASLAEAKEVGQKQTRTLSTKEVSASPAIYQAASMYANLAGAKASKLLLPTKVTKASHVHKKMSKQETPMSQAVHTGPLPEHFAVLDVETRYSAQDVGGWHKTHLMGVSLAVMYDSATDTFTTYMQDAIPDMAEVLKSIPLVIGFNIIRFDYPVLAPHAPGFQFKKLPTLDMLARIHACLSYRISLDNLATATLGAEKSANGLLALKWWKEGKMDLIEQYCRQDVLLTRDLFLFGRDNGYVLFTNKAGQKVRIRADWSPKEVA